MHDRESLRMQIYARATGSRMENFNTMITINPVTDSHIYSVRRANILQVWFHIWWFDCKGGDRRKRKYIAIDFPTWYIFLECNFFLYIEIASDYNILVGNLEITT